MTLIAKKPENKGVDIDPLKPGLHHGILYRVIDLGTQHNPVYNVTQEKILFIWELPRDRIEIEGEDLPRVISKIYTNSLHEKANLAKDLTSWFGKEPPEGLNFGKLLGQNCNLNIVNKLGKGDPKRTFSNVDSISPLMDNQKKEKPENEVMQWDIKDIKQGIPEELPDWIKNMIMQSMEYGAKDAVMANEAPTEEPPPPDDDEIPF